MSWTDIFPVMDDDMVELYLKEATLPEREEMASYFRVKEKHGERLEAKHVIACSLFWKHAWLAHGDFPVPTRELMKTAAKNDLMKRGLEPWSHYVLPLLRGAAAMRLSRPDIAFRVYLAQDLSFLIPDLLEVGCEIFVMEHNSLSHNPGAMWRMLALEESDRLVTITDSDRAANVLSDCERTESLSNLGLGHWRIPYFAHDVESEYHYSKWNKRTIGYRPIMMCQMGSRMPVGTQLLMEACIWNTRRRNLNPEVLLPGCGNFLPVYGFVWPDYGYDEWFALTSLYPRIAMNGLLTFVPVGGNAPLFSLDIEYATWANPRSEMVYFGNAGGCCPPIEKKARKTKPRSKFLSAILDKQKVVWKEKSQKKLAKSATDKITLVVARYKENVNWITRLPDGIDVILYNKGPSKISSAVKLRTKEIIQLPNKGREADTYIKHLLNYSHGKDNEWTVFVQGDPFPHSPDLLALLERCDHWSEVQGLTSGYDKKFDDPPSVVKLRNTDQWLGPYELRTEPFSIGTMDVIGWYEPTVRNITVHYREHHILPRGWSVGGHFLELCGLDDLAAQAWNTSALGEFSAGAQFAVRNHLLTKLPSSNLLKMKKLTREHYSHGYIFERMWLHLFGLPFKFHSQTK